QWWTTWLRTDYRSGYRATSRCVFEINNVLLVLCPIINITIRRSVVFWLYVQTCCGTAHRFDPRETSAIACWLGQDTTEDCLTGGHHTGGGGRYTQPSHRPRAANQPPDSITLARPFPRLRCAGFDERCHTLRAQAGAVSGADPAGGRGDLAHDPAQRDALEHPHDGQSPRSFPHGGP